MPVVAKFCGIVIRLLCLRLVGMRLHAFYGDSEMVLDLKSLRIIQDAVSEPERRMVMAWARAHQRELMAGHFAASNPGVSCACGEALAAL
jgi:Domain of unknown function (DUF4160)